ncbi:hypothetical protein [Brevibacillus sp. 179-C9.3 HS]|uniref:hypothetical protein n=1 Tax=unclassified Brevibacillus TaxID=2684853 RepID=UPI0039A0FE8E
MAEVMIQKIVDESIHEDMHRADPGLGKYRVEVHPFLPNVDRDLRIILISKGIVGIPFLVSRKAVIVPNDDYIITKTIAYEFPDFDWYDIQIGSHPIKASPYTTIQKINPRELSCIRFIDKKQLNKWQKPIRKAIGNYIIEQTKH